VIEEMRGKGECLLVKRKQILSFPERIWYDEYIKTDLSVVGRIDIKI
jgi:hypothetical protein